MWRKFEWSLWSDNMLPSMSSNYCVSFEYLLSDYSAPDEHQCYLYADLTYDEYSYAYITSPLITVTGDKHITLAHKGVLVIMEIDKNRDSKLVALIDGNYTSHWTSVCVDISNSATHIALATSNARVMIDDIEMKRGKCTDGPGSILLFSELLYFINIWNDIDLN